MVIGIIALSISILRPSLDKARETAHKAKCASNLHQIGLAILLYQNDNNQSYPRTIQDTTTNGNPGPTCGTPANATAGNPDPFAAPTETVNDVTASLFLLLRQEKLTPAVFVCPGSGHDNIYTGRAGIATTSAGPSVSGGTCNESSGSSPYDGQDSTLLPNANGS